MEIKTFLWMLIPIIIVIIVVLGGVPTLLGLLTQKIFHAKWNIYEIWSCGMGEEVFIMLMIAGWMGLLDL